VVGADPALAEAVGHKNLPRDFDLETARNNDELFVIKTHDHPINNDDKAIYLIRDGRESTVSYWHYLQNFVGDDFSLSDVLYGNVPFGLWSDHVERWNPLLRPQTLLVKFEELIFDPFSQLAPIASFLGKDVETRNLPRFNDLQEINPKFFRKGVVDSWRQELSKEQELTFWLLNLEQFTKFYPNENIPAANGDSQ
jgi:hypothetical protein